MLDIVRHWIPDLRQTSTKHAYVACQCPFCPKVTRSKSFRLNTKLKVWKCYQCGRSGKGSTSFTFYRKQRDIQRNAKRTLADMKRIGRHSAFVDFTFRNRIGIPIDVYHGCMTYYESILPF